MEFLPLILWSLAVGLLVILVKKSYKLAYWRGTGVPHYFSLPIVGIFWPVYLRQKSLIQMIHELHNAFPGAKYFGFIEGGSPTLLIKDADIIKDIAIKSFDNFPNHRNFVSEKFDPLMCKNIFSLKDERWREMRSTLSPSFTANKMKFIFTLVAKCSRDFVQHLKDHPELTKEFDMKDAYTRFTNDVIATSAFGISVDSMGNRENDFYANGISAVTFDFSRFITFMLGQNMPRLMRMLGMSFLPRKANNFFKKIVYDTVRMREDNGIVRPDMIHLLMHARDNAKNVAMDTDDIVAQAILFFLGGFDATSRLVCTASHALAHHPDIQTRLRDEVIAVLAEENGEVTYDTLGKMKYLDMVLSEALRMYPSNPFLDRVCSKEYILPPCMEGSKEYAIQPNTAVWFSAYGLHHDPRYFPEPEKFDPERFSPENKHNIEIGAYIPFGLGPRKCIADRFALMEVKILVINLMQNFVFKPSPKCPKVLEFSKQTFDMTPKDGFWMVMEPIQ